MAIGFLPEQLMSRPRRNLFRHTRTSEKTTQPNLDKQFRLVFAAAALAGVIAAIVVGWEQLFPIPPERLVEVYRTHGCRCVFAWTQSLKAEGFVVRLFEYQTLKHVRASLRTPTNLRGCHVAVYLDYFLEGHVSPLALHQLTQQRPHGLGLATESSVNLNSVHVSVARDEKSRVLLVEQNGRARRWFEPQRSERVMQ